MLESLFVDRQLWLTGITTFEKKCRTDHNAKHLRRKNGNKKIPVEASFTCSISDGPCVSTALSFADL